jgi:predicted nucleic acid-binding protein
VTGQVFVDTGAWYALQVRGDRWNTAATAALKLAIERNTPLVTSNHVVGETYTLLMTTHGQKAAWRFVETIAKSPRLEQVHVDAELEAEAYSLMRRYADQPFSFVDGTSFALMKKRRMRHAFAFDAHFSVAGFVRVPLEAEPP